MAQFMRWRITLIIEEILDELLKIAICSRDERADRFGPLKQNYATRRWRWISSG
jgi:hypothetical protein